MTGTLLIAGLFMQITVLAEISSIFSIKVN